MKPKELRVLDENALYEKQISLMQEKIELYIQKKRGTLEKPHKFKDIRRSVARIKTILSEK